MARPARPPEEAQAVREAAEIVRQETGQTSVSAISREIARRVTAELTTFIEQDDDDPMAMALERVRLNLKPCPFNVLATDAEIDTIQVFIKLRSEYLISRSGRYLSTIDQSLEQNLIARRMRLLLASRFARSLSE
jgi:hypothetical protein